MARKPSPHRRQPREQEGRGPAPTSLSAPSACRIRIVVADGHELIRVGIRALLESERDLDVVGEAAQVDELLTACRQIRPDVILVTDGLCGSTEAKTIQQLFHSLPAVRVIILVQDDDAALFRQAVDAGAQGFLLGNVDREELIKGIRTVAKGGSYLDPQAVTQTLRLLRQQQAGGGVPSGLHILSPQERRIISFIAEGCTNKEIAEKLTLSDKTVKNYVANMFTKLEVGRRTQAAALYLKAQSPRLKTARSVSRASSELDDRDGLFSFSG